MPSPTVPANGLDGGRTAGGPQLLMINTPLEWLAVFLVAAAWLVIEHRRKD